MAGSRQLGILGVRTRNAHFTQAPAGTSCASVEGEIMTPVNSFLVSYPLQLHILERVCPAWAPALYGNCYQDQQNDQWLKVPACHQACCPEIPRTQMVEGEALKVFL